MSKCPSCGKEIDHLLINTSVIVIDRVSWDGKELLFEEWDVREEEDVGFYCPVCVSVIVNNLDEAEEFLK